MARGPCSQDAPAAGGPLAGQKREGENSLRLRGRASQLTAQLEESAEHGCGGPAGPTKMRSKWLLVCVLAALGQQNARSKREIISMMMLRALNLTRPRMQGISGSIGVTRP